MNNTLEILATENSNSFRVRQENSGVVCRWNGEEFFCYQVVNVRGLEDWSFATVVNEGRSLKTRKSAERYAQRVLEKHNAI